MPEYTLATLLTMLVVLLLELLALKTGLFRTLQYWVSLAIVLGFQILVDGWLTKLSAPIVQYAPEKFSGIRAPWDIPVEDFGFGWAMITLALLLWQALARRDERPSRRRSPRTEPPKGR